MAEEKEYFLFDDLVDEEVFTPFKKIYEDLVKGLEIKGLSDNQREILAGVSGGLSYGDLMKQMDKKHIASIQSGLKGGVKNLLQSIFNIVWLYNNPSLLDWLSKNGHKHVK